MQKCFGEKQKGMNDKKLTFLSNACRKQKQTNADYQTSHTNDINKRQVNADANMPMYSVGLPGRKAQRCDENVRLP
jgi:hypothetical protein